MFIRRVQLVGMLLVSFLLGAVAATVYETQALETSGKRRRGRHSMMADLSEKLALTANQKAQLSQILDETRKRMTELSKATRPQYQQIKRESRAQIRGILTVEQAQRFDALMEARDKRRRQRSEKKRGAVPHTSGTSSS